MFFIFWKYPKIRAYFKSYFLVAHCCNFEHVAFFCTNSIYRTYERLYEVELWRWEVHRKFKYMRWLHHLHWRKKKQETHLEENLEAGEVLYPVVIVWLSDHAVHFSNVLIDDSYTWTSQKKNLFIMDIGDGDNINVWCTRSTLFVAWSCLVMMK